MSHKLYDIDFKLRHQIPKVFPLLVREQTQHSFYKFFLTFWETATGSSRPESFNWHVRYLCDQLQTIAERVFRNEARTQDLIINIPPGATKCEVAGNPILTPKGYVAIENLDLNDTVFSLGKDKRLFEQRITNKGSFYTDCVTVHTDYRLKGTAC